jgi:hypothetical protein
MKDIIIALLFIVSIPVSYIGMGLLFVKANMKRYQAFIPLYNQVILMKKFNKHRYEWLYVVTTLLQCISFGAVLGICLCFVFAGMEQDPSFVRSIADFALQNTWLIQICSYTFTISGLISIITQWRTYKNLCNNLGAGNGYVIGLLVCPAVFWVSLGIDKDMIPVLQSDNDKVILTNDTAMVTTETN